MPPKKIIKLQGGEVSMDTINPRVILRPLRAESGRRYRHSTLPPTASLFKKPEFSDVKLKVGDQSYYAHRLILCAGSDVFARMFGGSKWIEKESNKLELQEEEECVKVFETFLYYFYTGNIILREASVIPLFMLADKYNVKEMYEECVKVIENGLKVYVTVIPKSNTSSSSQSEVPSTSGIVSYSQHPFNLSSSSSYSESDSDTDSSDNEERPPAIVPQASSSNKQVVPPGVKQVASSGVAANVIQSRHQILAASETFPLTLVMKMLMYCHNERVTSAALYNLEARLCKHITHGNYAVWNDLDHDLLTQMLSDDFFYCNEYVLFHAARSYLTYQSSRQVEPLMSSILTCIRYPLLSASDLYEVEKDDVIKKCPIALKLVQEAVRYKLFHKCPRAAETENWTGVQFKERHVKE